MDRNWRPAAICTGVLICGVALAAWWYSRQVPVVSIPIQGTVVDVDFRPGHYDFAVCWYRPQSIDANLFIYGFNVSDQSLMERFRGLAYTCDWSNDGSSLFLGTGFFEVSQIEGDQQFERGWSVDCPVVGPMSISSVGRDDIVLIGQGPIGEFAPTPPSQPILISKNGSRKFGPAGFPFCVTTFGETFPVLMAISFDLETPVQVGTLNIDAEGNPQFTAHGSLPLNEECYMRFTPEGRELATLSATELAVWNVETFQKLRSVAVSCKVSTGMIQRMAVSRNDLVATAETGQTIVRRVSNLSVVFKLSRYSNCVDLSDDGTLIGMGRRNECEIYRIDDSSR